MVADGHVWNAREQTLHFSFPASHIPAHLFSPLTFRLRETKSPNRAYFEWSPLMQTAFPVFLLVLEMFISGSIGLKRMIVLLRRIQPFLSINQVYSSFRDTPFFSNVIYRETWNFSCCFSASLPRFREGCRAIILMVHYYQTPLVQRQKHVPLDSVLSRKRIPHWYEGSFPRKNTSSQQNHFGGIIAIFLCPFREVSP